MTSSATRTADPRARSAGGDAKSLDAFRTISEVSDELDVPQHVLRFWETKFAQVKPMKRAGGRRYYRPEDVRLLTGIRDLLYADGYTIKGVQRMLRQGGRNAVAADRRPLEDAAAAGTVGSPADAAEMAIAPEPSVPPAPPRDLSDAARAEIAGILDHLTQLRDALREMAGRSR